MDNICDDIPEIVPDELFQIISQSNDVKIERIISDGHSSPLDFWYDQDQYEFVIILEGEAILEYKDGHQHAMAKGDYVTIPPHQKHRVASTSIVTKTIWLTVSFN